MGPPDDKGRSGVVVSRLSYFTEKTRENKDLTIPTCSMYGIFTYIYRTNDPDVGRCSIHGAPGIGCMILECPSFRLTSQFAIDEITFPTRVSGFNLRTVLIQSHFLD